MPTSNTNIKGPIAVTGDNDEMIGIDCRTADIKYTMLAALINWRINAFGKNVISEYLVVLIELYGREGLFYLPKATVRWSVSCLVNNSPIYLLSLYYRIKTTFVFLFIYLQLKLTFVFFIIFSYIQFHSQVDCLMNQQKSSY